MPSWTPDQQLAIDKEGKNIIVSAGAGSGKTAVLTARVIRKLKDGVDINKLLVLTFTNEAANEMKDRIRSEIQKEPSLKKQLDYIDSAYITTFDSFALSIVKKYHYLLNLPKNISIVDSSIINIKKEEYIDKIFKNLYEEENEKFLKLINDFTVKDDKDIKKQILKINKLLELKYDKKDYLNTYINNFYSETYIQKQQEEYLNLITSKKELIKNVYDEILILEESKKIEEYTLALNDLLNANTYDEIKSSLDFSLPRIVKNSKEQKEQIKEIQKELKELTFYENIETIKNIYLSTKDYTEVIIDIINKLDIMVNLYKNKNSSYEFIDISKMAIDIVTKNEEIKDEIKYFYNEIMVDEYQDTNDLQEMFISKIENNNVYMVGDIKQSIYRFRNANPLIFKNKYDLYSEGEKGIKIDLLKNFRSRKEVLSDINTMFNKVMDNFLGGAEYQESHQMVFGNDVYEKHKMEDETSNLLEIYNYDSKELKEFDKNEKEAFIIAKDIKNKINSGYMIFDKDKKVFRKAEYKDFCIIMDRGTDFDLYRKIFEYEDIPLVAYQDEILTTEYDVFIIKNLINLIIKVKKYEFDTEFKYLFTSIARSYLFRLSDEEIFSVFKDNTFKETEIYIKAKEIANELDNLSCHSFLEKVLDKFNFYEKCLSYRNIDKTLVRILYLQNISKSLENLGFTPYMLGDYLDKMIDSDENIKYKLNTKDETSVKIMNIHKSKGLEFPVCYYSGLYKKFNIRDLVEKFLFDNKYGIVTPYFDNGIGTLPTKYLIKENYIKEEISEKIRLLYVSVTRAREKMIFVAPLDEDVYNKEDLVNNTTRLKYRSFLDIVNTIKDEFDVYIKNINLEDINLTKDYNIYINKNLDFLKESNEKIDKRSIKIETDEINESKFSKINNNLITKDEKNNMKYGTDIHYLFENTDFKEKTDNKYINRFLSHDLLKNINNANIYKEYEFMDIENNNISHGIIDLMLEYENHIDIIDYKLSNIDDPNYKKQLDGYKKYIEIKTNKKVNTYLYSIEKDIIKEV